MKEAFLDALLKMWEKREIPPSDVRKKAWDLFCQMDLSSEIFSKVSSFSSLDVPLTPASTASKCIIVMNNGMLDQKNSHLPKEVVLLSLSQAKKSYEGFLHARHTQTLLEEKNPLALLNLALHQDGVFVLIPPHVHVKEPIHCLHFVSKKQPFLMFPRMHIFIGKGAKASFVFSSLSWINQVLDIVVEEKAECTLIHLQKPEEWSFEGIRVQAKKQAIVHTMHACQGSQWMQKDIQVSLLGEQAEAECSGVWTLQGCKEAHFKVTIDHRAPHTRSMQLFKGVLGETSRSTFEGKIFVRRSAQKTEAYQLNRNLLLSKRAVARSHPHLEIFADDAKASHGSTTGELSSHEMFYLKTRGLSEKMAQQLLIAGFCREVIHKIPFPSLQEQWERDGSLHA